MRVFYFKPYGQNLYDAYAESMSLLQPDDWAVLLDHDTMLFGDTGAAIERAIQANPDAGMITAYTNRSGYPSQQYMRQISANGNVAYWSAIAKKLQQQQPTYTDITNEHVTGALMAIKKSTWDSLEIIRGGHKFLGVDDAICAAIRKAGKKIIRINNLLFFHFYRLDTGIHNTKHLQK
jgi:GT2 family glycosyltransferase